MAKNNTPSAEGTPVPPVAPVDNNINPATDLTPAPKKSIVWWVTIAAVIIIILGAGFAAMTNRNNAIDTTDALVSTGTATSTAGDTVTQELQSVSKNTDSGTIKSELENTSLDDIATELDDISAETKGL